MTQPIVYWDYTTQGWSYTAGDGLLTGFPPPPPGGGTYTLTETLGVISWTLGSTGSVTPPSSGGYSLDYSHSLNAAYAAAL